MYSRENLFVTPLWTFKVTDSAMLNRKLLVDSKQYKSNSKFFDLLGEGVAELKEFVYNSATQVAREENWQYTDLQVSSRQNPMFPGEYDTPHHHLDSDLLGIYYVKTPDNCGDIQFLDSRGAISIRWQDKLVKDDGEFRSARAFVKIKPESGTLLLFPSYLIHSVEPNRSNDVRLSIVFEFKFINESVSHGY
jgi:uncharacterized protein (TIGR02466 family)